MWTVSCQGTESTNLKENINSINQYVKREKHVHFHAWQKMPEVANGISKACTS